MIQTVGTSKISKSDHIHLLKHDSWHDVFIIARPPCGRPRFSLIINWPRLRSALSLLNCSSSSTNTQPQATSSSSNYFQLLLLQPHYSQPQHHCRQRYRTSCGCGWSVVGGEDDDIEYCRQWCGWWRRKRADRKGGEPVAVMHGNIERYTYLRLLMRLIYVQCLPFGLRRT